MSKHTGVITKSLIRYIIQERRERIKAVKQKMVEEGKKNGSTFYTGWLKGFAEGMEEIELLDEARANASATARLGLYVEDDEKLEIFTIAQRQTEKQKKNSTFYKSLMRILDDYWLSQPEEARVRIDLHFQHASGMKQHKTLIWNNILKGPEEKEYHEMTRVSDIKEEDPPGWIM